LNKLIRLSPTGIEYGDCAWNFASGCGNNIDGNCKGGGFRCWAYSITRRFPSHYPNGFKPTIYPEALLSPLYLKKPSRILCAFMGDLFWDCPEFSPDALTGITSPLRHDKELTLREVLWDVMHGSPQHTFLMLTKRPQNLVKFSPFPENCWVGVSIVGGGFAIPNFITLNAGLGDFYNFEAKIKFISFEPLLYEPTPFAIYRLTEVMLLRQVNWVIIGAQTKPYKPPKIEWVREIVEACDKAGIPVFLKNNLYDLFMNAPHSDLFWEDMSHLRQEMADAR